MLTQGSTVSSLESFLIRTLLRHPIVINHSEPVAYRTNVFVDTEGVCKIQRLRNDGIFTRKYKMKTLGKISGSVDDLLSLLSSFGFRFSERKRLRVGNKLEKMTSGWRVMLRYDGRFTTTLSYIQPSYWEKFQ